jgi:hypothetical protein
LGLGVTFTGRLDMQFGKLNPVGTAKIEFPGFQEILDFTSTGAESSISATVDGDTDKEYKIMLYSTDTDSLFYMTLNGDSGNNYGYQRLTNTAGTIAAARGETSVMAIAVYTNIMDMTLLTPTGLIKTLFYSYNKYTTGTTIDRSYWHGCSYNSTSNITSITFTSDAGAWAAGVRVFIYARRSQS